MLVNVDSAEVLELLLQAIFLNLCSILESPWGRAVGGGGSVMASLAPRSIKSEYLSSGTQASVFLKS